MKLIPEARNWWRMFSQQAFIAAGALQGAWLMLAPEQKASVPEVYVTVLTICVVALGFLGRLIDQPSVNK